MPAPKSGGQSTASGSIPSDGSDPPKLDEPNLLSFCLPITLKFVDLTYKIKTESSEQSDRTILQNVTGIARPGEILAILGPSGSGKSTLLNALAGRLSGSKGLTGSVYANNRRFDRPVQRRTGFVTQDDILLPNLTVRETLIYCSLLRLPRALTYVEKVNAADRVITEMGLEKCRDTAVGSSFVRGVSGGERKRVSIAHELLLNPSLLILDEPTSGLDSTAAHRLVSALSAQRRRTVVASVHQPSSRLFQMFDSVLVLSEGRSIYFGRGREAMGYFETLGFSPSFPMNPADFLLDLANGVFQQHDGVTERSDNNNNHSTRQHLVSAYNTILSPKIKESLSLETTTTTTPGESKDYNNNNNNKTRRSTLYSISAATWWNQFNVLLRRNLKERRHEAFNPLRVFQVAAAAALSGLMWWRSNPGDVQDRLGLLFFVTIFWGVLPSFNAVFAFPQERAVLSKERASGMYGASAYFAAHAAGDAPAELVLPAGFLALSYFMAGLRPEPGAFLATLLVLLFYVLVSQGLGLALGAALMDAKRASTIVTVTMLAFVLTGGFYVHRVPYCLGWVKFCSTTFYAYRLLVAVQYGDGREISGLLGCRRGGESVAAGCKFVEDDVEGQISPAVCLGALMVMFFGYRLLAYLCLRRLK